MSQVLCQNYNEIHFFALNIHLGKSNKQYVWMPKSWNKNEALDAKYWAEECLIN